MPAAARKGDPTAHGGLIVEGSPNVTIGGMPAARLLDKHVCPLHGPGPITETSATVMINGVGAARMTDKCTCLVPSTGVGGGSGSAAPKLTPPGISIGPKKKWGDNSQDWRKDYGEDVKTKKKSDNDPKLAAQVSAELWKGGNAHTKKGAFETNVTEAKVTAKAGYEGDLKNLKNAKADAAVKAEAEYSAVKLQGKAGDTSKGSLAEGKAEAKVLTAKANATAGGKFEVKDGKLQSAYAEAEVGAGASVVEAKAAGQTKAFKLPFVNWGISFGGEVSGSLLTAEAKAGAYAGYRDNKWTFGVGAKIGAALAGLGFKFNVSIEKLPPPAPAPAPPGVPGVAGIDPIVMGCLTVIFGGMPPPYIPGPPKKLDPPKGALGGPGGRNKAEKADYDEDPIERRIRDNKELEMKVLPSGMTQLEADMAKVGVTKARLDAMRAKEFPLSFPDKATYDEFKKELRQTLAESGLGDADLRMRGTSTTFYSENPKKKLGHHFDANPAELADVDIETASASLAKDMQAAGYPPHPAIPTIYKTRHVMEKYPKLDAFAQKWTQKLGRDVNFVGLTSPAHASKSGSDFIL
jgi:uncharacterized Zn-binding protein involved in type VI secretion